MLFQLDCTWKLGQVYYCMPAPRSMSGTMYLIAWTTVETYASYFLIYIFYCCSSTVVSIFPHHNPLPHRPPTPTLHPTPFGFVHGSFIHVLDNLSPSFPHYLPLPYPLVTVSLFFISMSLVISCLFVCSVDYIPFTGEIIWYCLLPSGLFHLA